MTIKYLVCLAYLPACKYVFTGLRQRGGAGCLAHGDRGGPPPAGGAPALAPPTGAAPRGAIESPHAAGCPIACNSLGEPCLLNYSCCAYFEFCILFCFMLCIVYIRFQPLAMPTIT